jgi:peptide-methionine (S)-S-oxide reductase
MAPRYMATLVALLISLAVESKAQESPKPDAVTPAPSTVKSEAKDSPNEATRSPGDKKTVSPSDSIGKPKTEQATFGAGCFWHVEAVFERLKGVNWAVSGYAGGAIPYPSYEMVHEGTTGHAEVVMVDFDPEIITYDDLLKVFWKNHDPTSINRQGEDEGPQYRSVIFYHNEAQRLAALKSYRALTERRAYRSPIVTQLVPMRAFYRAEEYHQNYYGGKPRASTRRKSTTAKVKKSAGAKGKNAPSVVKRADSDPVASAPSSAPESNPDQGSTP